MRRAPNGFSGKVPLRIAMIAPVIMLTAAVAGVVGYLGFRNGRQAVNDVASQLRTDITVRIEEHLRSFLDTPHKINEVNASALRHGLLQADNPDVMERLFWEQVQAFDSVTSIYFGNTRGGLVNSGREGPAGSRYVIVTDGFVSGSFRKYATDSQGNRTRLIQTVAAFDARTRPWYTAAITKGDAVWSPVYVLYTGQDMALAASRPVYDKREELLGVVSVDIFLSHLNKFLQGLKIGETGRAFIIERSGMLVASSTNDKLLTEPGGAESQRRLHASESPTPIIRDAARTLTERFGDCRDISAEKQIEFESNGKRQFLQVTPVQHEYGIDWLVAVAIPEDDFMAHISYHNRITGMLILAALIMAILIGMVASHSVLKPILLLNASARTLANGEWTQTLRDESWLREISELTRSFSQMVQHLKQTVESLNHEVAERRQAEEALRESEQKYRAIFDNAAVGINLKLPGGKFLEVNQFLINTLGYSREELNKLSYLDITHPEDVQISGEKHAALERGDIDTYRIEKRCLGKSGRVIWIDTSVKALRDSLGELRGTVGIIADITERRNAEEALKKSQQNLQTLFQTVDDLLFVLDSSGKIVGFNPAVEKRLGYSERDLIGMDVLNVHPPERRDEAASIIRDILEGKTDSCPVPLITRDRQLIPVETKVTLGKWNNQEAIFGISRDITERLKLEFQVQQTKKAESLGRMAGAIAHHYNNLFTIVLGNLELALDELPSGSRLLENIAEAIRASRRAAEISNLMLAYLGQGIGKMEPMDLSETCRSVLPCLPSSLPKKTRLKAEFPARGPIVRADVEHVKQVLANLVVNAGEAIGDGEGDITVAIAVIPAAGIGKFRCYPSRWEPKAEAYACLSVTDTGCGMNPETMDKVFDPFFSTKFTGRGLGLAVAAGVVKAHGGAVSVDSVPGRGTVFRVFLPLTAEKPLEPAKTAPVEPATVEGQGLVLIVEDEPMLRNMARKMLMRLGFESITAADGVEAVEVFRQRQDQIHCVLLDLTMPRMDGWETLAVLRRIRPDVLVILASGYDKAQVMEGEHPQLPQVFLHKPYSLASLKAALEKVVKEW